MTTDTFHRPEPIEYPRRTVHFYDLDAKHPGPHLAHVERANAVEGLDLIVHQSWREPVTRIGVLHGAGEMRKFYRWP